MGLFVLFSVMALAVAAFGVRIAHLRWRHEDFVQSGRGIHTQGVCINLRFRPGSGLVASLVHYTDEEGRQHVAATPVSTSIPIQVGATAEVTYDPKGKAIPLVNGEAQATGGYGFAVVCFALAAVFLFNGLQAI
ncbi:hypothetical protein [Streptomyces sp. NPDC059452]|uniref:hypothetical protein n=1 Tax=Streptomyces sp. NPDC059452 TaxID=3346835 RepID=UPI00367933B3